MSGRHAGRHSLPPSPSVEPRGREKRAASNATPGVRRASQTSVGAALGVILLASAVIDPTAGAAAQTVDNDLVPSVAVVAQYYSENGGGDVTLTRSAVDTKKLQAEDSDTLSSSASTSLPTVAASDVQQYAHAQVLKRGWSEADFTCLVKLWNRESHWNYKALNRGSGAYGIPQALPGSKMASAGSDWETNPDTQVDWGLGYIAGRYSTPCGAWNHSQSSGWY